MGQSAQQFLLRATALIAAIPQPGLIRGEKRDAALIDTIKDQQGAIFHPRHHDGAALCLKVDLAQPAAPWRGGLCLESRCHRVAIAQIGDLRHITLFDHPRRGPCRQDSGQGRAVERRSGGEIGAGGDKHRPAVADVVGDILKIERRQDTPPLVAVEDDQIEILDLLHEEFTGGKSDQ